MKTFEQIADQILRLAETGHEHQVNESLHFGMGLYAYNEDVTEYGNIEHIPAADTVFSYFNSNRQNLILFLQFLKERDGYLAIL